MLTSMLSARVARMSCSRWRFAASEHTRYVALHSDEFFASSCKIREARSSRKSERLGRRCRYAEAVVAAPLKKVSKSALIWSALVAGMPCGKPLYTFSVAFFSIFADLRPAAAIGTI